MSIRKHGLTLIEILMVISLVGILTAVSLTLMEKVSQDAAFDKTYGKMLLIKTALIGDLDTNKQGLREDFGFLGDVGAIPTATQGLQALLTQPAAIPAYGIDTVSRTGMGWRGPYLKSTTGVSWLKDAWARDFVYDPTASPPYLLSYGSDGLADGTAGSSLEGAAKDIKIELGPDLTTAKVHFRITENNTAYRGKYVAEVYYPVNGVRTTKTFSQLTTGTTVMGMGTLDNIPFGVRSIKIYVGQATATTTAQIIASPVDTIGPSLIPIDNANYVVPYNYTDSAPGAMPHACAGGQRVIVVPGTLNESSFGGTSTGSQRLYFSLDISESIKVSSIYVSFANNADFEALRVGNDIKSCQPSAGFKCMEYNFLGIELEDNADASPSLFCLWCDPGYNTDTKLFPEIPIRAATPWEIPSGSGVGAYIETDPNGPGVSGILPVDLRLGCDLLRLE